MVERVIDTDRQLQSASGAEQIRLRRRFENLDAELDGLIYQLYGLSDEVIHLIERWTPAGAGEESPADPADETSDEPTAPNP